MIKKGDKVKLPSGKEGTVIELANKTGSDGTQQIVVSVIPDIKVVSTVLKVTKV